MHIHCHRQRQKHGTGTGSGGSAHSSHPGPAATLGLRWELEGARKGQGGLRPNDWACTTLHCDTRNTLGLHTHLEQ